jgi:hypothetical protein
MKNVMLDIEELETKKGILWARTMNEMVLGELVKNMSPQQIKELKDRAAAARKRQSAAKKEAKHDTN